MPHIHLLRGAFRPLTTLLVLATAFTGTHLNAAIDAPVSPNAQPNVAQLMQFLDSVKGNHVLSGQQEIAWDLKRNDEDFDYILKTTGKLPAVRGFDFLEYVYSPSVRANQNATERAIAWARAGGIVNFCCHMFMDTGSPAGSPQFYVPGANGNSTGTTFDISKAVVSGTTENTEYLAKLDIIASELKKLRDAGVVVVWRPFHEASGGWFWWSAKGAAPLKQAWRIMFDRFTVMHGLNNLIWCFNPTDPIGTNLANWYPGDDVVDMISNDTYPSAGTHLSFSASYNQMQSFN
jgi:mannan endo-1,4-beta-mannosidase